MSVIDENRLKIYELLYSNPMCKYIKERCGQKTLNVLIDISDYKLKNLALRACLWCGQFPDTELSIALINFDGIEISDEWGKYARIHLKSDDEKYDYILDKNCMMESVKLNAIENLERIAKNLNYAYELAKDQKKSIEDIRFKSLSDHCSSLAAAVHTKYKLYFTYSALKQLKNKDVEKAEKRNGFGENDEKLWAFAFNKLLEKVDDKNEEYIAIYNKLISFEHKRWMIYTLTDDICNFKKPTLEQIQQNVYCEDNYSHKFTINGTNYHACLCECGNSGVILSNNNLLWSYTEEAIDDALQEKEISELDWLSLLCRVKQKKLIDKNASVYDSFKNDIKALLCDASFNNLLRDLQYSFSEMKKGTDGAKGLFNKTLTIIGQKNFALKIEIEKLKESLKYKQYLDVLFSYNDKIDFFKYDEQNVRLTPFVISYRREKVAVLTIGNNPQEDVILPTIVMPEKSIYIISEYEERYNAIIKDYYSIRPLGQYEIEKVSNKNYDIISSKIGELKGEGYLKIVFNVTSASVGHLISLGQLYNNYSDYPILFYDKTKGKGEGRIEAYDGTCSEYKWYPSKNFSVYEYLPLIGEAIKTSQDKNSTNITTSMNELEIMSKYYFKETSYLNYDTDKKHLDELKKKGVSEDLVRILGEKKGNLLETITFGRFYYSNLFDEVCSGLELEWGKGCNDNKNEFDIVAIKGFNSVHVSCKAYIPSKENIHEVVYWAYTYNCHVILAVSCKMEKCKKELKRTTDSNVLLLTADELSDQDAFNEAVKDWINNNYKCQ